MPENITEEQKQNLKNILTAAHTKGFSIQQLNTIKDSFYSKNNITSNVTPSKVTTPPTTPVTASKAPVTPLITTPTTPVSASPKIVSSTVKPAATVIAPIAPPKQPTNGPGFFERMQKIVEKPFDNWLNGNVEGLLYKGAKMIFAETKKPSKSLVDTETRTNLNKISEEPYHSPFFPNMALPQKTEQQKLDAATKFFTPAFDKNPSIEIATNRFFFPAKVNITENKAALEEEGAAKAYNFIAATGTTYETDPEYGIPIRNSVPMDDVTLKKIRKDAYDFKQKKIVDFDNSLDVKMEKELRELSLKNKYDITYGGTVGMGGLSTSSVGVGGQSLEELAILDRYKKLKLENLKTIEGQYQAFVTDYVAPPQYDNALLAKDILGIALPLKEKTVENIDANNKLAVANIDNTINIFNNDKNLYNTLVENGNKSQNIYDPNTEEVVSAAINSGQQAADIYNNNLNTVKPLQKITLDGLAYQGLVDQIGVINQTIKSTTAALAEFNSEDVSDLTPEGLKAHNIIGNGIQANLIKLQELKGTMVDWGVKNLAAYSEYQVRQDKVTDFGLKDPTAAVSGSLMEHFGNLPKDIYQITGKVGMTTGEGNKKFYTQPLATGQKDGSTVPANLVIENLMNQKAYSDIRPQIKQDGVFVNIDKAEAIQLFDKETGKFVGFENMITPTAFFYQVGKTGLESTILGGIGGATEAGIANVGETLIGQTLKNQAASYAAKGGLYRVGDAVISTAITTAKIGNRITSMVLPTGVLYGNQMYTDFRNQGFDPEQSKNLTLLSVFFEGGFEAAFGNDVKLYNALLGKTESAVLKKEAAVIFDKAIGARILEATGRPATIAELSLAKRLVIGTKSWLKNTAAPFAKQGIKVGLEESAEEEGTGIATALIIEPKQKEYNPSYVEKGFSAEDALTTMVTTMATMLPMMGRAGYHHIQQGRVEALQAKFEVGSAPLIHLQNLKNSFDLKQISKEDYEKAVVYVEQYASLKKGIDGAVENAPNLRSFTNTEKENIKLQIFSEQLKKSDIEQQIMVSITDKQKTALAEQLSAIDDHIANLIENGTYTDIKQRNAAQLFQLDYLFNDKTIPLYNDPIKLGDVMNELEAQQAREIEPKIIAAYDQKINALADRFEEILKERHEAYKKEKGIVDEEVITEEVPQEGITDEEIITPETEEEVAPIVATEEATIEVMPHEQISNDLDNVTLENIGDFEKQIDNLVDPSLTSEELSKKKGELYNKLWDKQSDLSSPETAKENAAAPTEGAPEQTPQDLIPSTREAETDMPIGKVGNTEYEVKADGIEYKGKKLDNPKNLPHKQLITEDIERRKQEELNINTQNIKFEQDFYDKKAKEQEEWIQKYGKNDDGIEQGVRMAVGSLVRAKEERNKINAKYKEELDALEVKPTTTTTEDKSDNIKNRNRKDLFPDESEFADVIGGSGQNSKISSYKEVNGIGIAEYTNPKNGLVDVIMTGTSDNDYVGYVRIYTKSIVDGKVVITPSERWTSKMENKSQNKANIKTMLAEVQRLLPAGHEYTEKTNISLDGLKTYAQQLKYGYEILLDKDGKPVVNQIILNKASVSALQNAKSQEEIDDLYNSYENLTRAEYDEIKAKINALMPEARVLPFNETKGTINIDLPVLKSTKTVEPTTDNKTDIEAKKAELKYSIQQLENDLASRVSDFVKKGASLEEAKKLAYNEFPKADRISLEKLKLELAALEKQPTTDTKADIERRRQVIYNKQYNDLVSGNILDNQGEPVYEEDKGIGANSLSTLTDKKYGHGHIRTSGLNSLKVLEDLLEGGEFSGMFGQIGQGSYTTWESGKFIIVSNNINPTKNNKLNLNEIEIILNAGLTPFAQELANKYPNVIIKDFNGKKYDAELAALEKPETKTVDQQIADLRAQEQVEYESMTDPNDKAAKEEIYDRYDKLITPLLKSQKKEVKVDVKDNKAILQKKEERLANVKPVYHYTTIAPQDFNFNSFQRETPIGFGNGLNASSTPSRFLAKKYANNPAATPIQGEVNDKDFIEIDANKSQKEVYEMLVAKGYKFNNPQIGKATPKGATYMGGSATAEYDDTDKLNYNPGASIDLFVDFQQSNPEVKGVKILNHIIGKEKVAPFYVIYDAKAFYGQNELTKKIEQETNEELNGSFMEVISQDRLEEIKDNRVEIEKSNELPEVDETPTPKEEQGEEVENLKNKGLTFKLGKGFTAVWDSKQGKFIYFKRVKKQDVEIDNFKQIVRLANLTSKIPGIAKTWYKDLLNSKQRQGVNELILEYRNALQTLQGVEDYKTGEDFDTIESYLMRAIQGGKFKSKQLEGDVTDVNRKYWFSAKGKDLDEYITHDLMNPDIKSGLIQSGFSDYSARDVQKIITDLIMKYPRGITKEDIEQDNPSPFHTLRYITDDFIYEYGISLEDIFYDTDIEELKQLNLDEEIQNNLPGQQETTSDISEAEQIISEAEQVEQVEKLEAKATEVVNNNNEIEQKRIIIGETNYNPLGSVMPYGKIDQNHFIYLRTQRALFKLRELQAKDPMGFAKKYFATVQKNTDKLLDQNSINANLAPEKITNGVIVLITDEKGLPYLFDNDGNISNEGSPIFQNFNSSKTIENENKKKEIDLLLTGEGLSAQYDINSKRVARIREALDKNPTKKITFTIDEITPTENGQKSSERLIFSTKDLVSGQSQTLSQSTSTSTSTTQGKVKSISVQNYTVDVKNSFGVPVKYTARMPKISTISLKQTLQDLLDLTKTEGLPEELQSFSARRELLRSFMFVTHDSEYNKFLQGTKSAPLRYFAVSNNEVRVILRNQNLSLEEWYKSNDYKFLELNENREFLGNLDFKMYNWDSQTNKFVATKEQSYKDFILSNITFEGKNITQKVSTIKLANDVSFKPKEQATEQVDPIIPQESPLTEKPKDEGKKDFDALGDGLDDFTNVPLNRLKILPSRKLTQKQESKATEWFNKYQSKTGVSKEDMTNIANDVAYAQWYRGAITLFKGSTSADLYHEAFHDFTQLYLTKKQKIALYNEVAKTKEGQKILNTLKKDATDLEKYHALEELMAEDFKNYMLSDQKLILNERPKRNSIFRKIFNFLKEFFTNQPSLETIYKNLANNKIKGQRDFSNAMFGTLNSDIKGLDEEQTQDVYRIIDSVIGDKFRKTGLSIAGFFKDKNKLRAAYNSVHDSILETYKQLENTPENALSITNSEFILANWNNVRLSHVQNSPLLRLSKEYIKIDEDEFDEEKPEVKGSMYDDDSSRSVREKASAQLIYLIATQPAYLQVGDKQIPKPNAFLPYIQDVEDFNSLWNNVANILNGTLTYDQQYKKLQKEAETNLTFKSLISSLPNPLQKLDGLSAQLRNQFIIMFSQPLIPMKIMNFRFQADGSLNVTANNATVSSINKIKEDWKYNLQSSKNPYATVNYLGRNELDIDKVLEDFVNIGIRPEETKIAFLNALGISFSPKTLRSEDFKTFLSDKDKLKRLYDSLKKIQTSKNDDTLDFRAREKASQPFYDATISFTSLGDQATLKELADIEVKNGDKYIGDNMLNANGDSTYGIRQYSQQSMMFAYLNDYELYPTYDALTNSPIGAVFDITKNPDADNIFLRSLFNLKKGENFGVRYIDKKTNKPLQITLYNHNGLSITSFDELPEPGETTLSLSRFLKAVQDISPLLESGEKENLRYGDKVTANGTLTTFKREGILPALNPHIPVDIKDFKNSYLPEQAYSIFKNRLFTTLKRTNDFFVNGTLQDATAFSTNVNKGDYFGILDGMLSEETKKILSQDIKDKELDISKLLKDNETIIRKDIADYMKELVEDYSKELSKNKLIDPSKFVSTFLLNTHGFDTILKAYIANSYILNMEHISLFFQDIRFYTDKNNYKEPFKRFSKATSTGIRLVNDPQINAFLQGTDEELKHYNAINGTNILERDKSLPKLSAIFNDIGYSENSPELKDILDMLDKVFKNSSKEDLLNIRKAHIDMKPTDAMAFCTFDFYREVAIKSGNDEWSPEKNSLYKKIATEQKLTEEETKSAFLFFPPEKLRVVGYTQDKDGNVLPIDYKFAISPLLGSIVKGKGYEVIKDNMLRQQVSLGLFNSASKHSSIGVMKDNKLQQNALYNEDNTPNSGDWVLNPIQQDFIFEVVPSPKTYKGEATFSTQLRKLLFVNSFDNSIPIDYKGTKPFNTLTEAEKIKQSYIYYLDNTIANAIDDLITLEKNTILNKIGATLNTKTDKYTFDDAKLSAFLEEELSKRNISKNALDTLKVIDGKFKYSLDSSLQRESLEQILLSIIDNKLKKQKSIGESLIQASSIGYENFNKAIKIKPEVKKLFESNPELANQVYEALGFVKNLNKLKVQDMKTKVAENWDTIKSTSKDLRNYIENQFAEKHNLTQEQIDVLKEFVNIGEEDINSNPYVDFENFEDRPDLIKKYNLREKEFGSEWARFKYKFPNLTQKQIVEIGQIEDISGYIAREQKGAFLSEIEGESGLPNNMVDLELSKITPEQKQQALQQYSQYLDSVFPDSQVKDIVYRSQAERGDISRVHVGKYFSISKEYSAVYGKTYNTPVREFLVNISSPKNLYIPHKKSIKFTENTIDGRELDFQNLSKEDIDFLRNKGYNGVIITEEEFRELNIKETVGKEIIVFEPEQIHILGSKQDIKGFKKFLSKPSSKKVMVSSWKNVGGWDLPYYGYEGRTLPDGTKVTSAHKVKIALQGDFKKLLDLKDVKDLANNPDVIKEAKAKGEGYSPEMVALNRLLKDEKWLDKDNNRRLVSIIGVRIPVQGHNSKEFMEVFEFLPTEAGPIVIVSPALVAKSGGDFDWDKVTSSFPSFEVNKEGKAFIYKKVEGLDNPKNNLNNKKALNNIINDAMRKVLERTENIQQLLIPNSTHLLEPLADARKAALTNKKASWSDVASPQESLNQHESNSVGKQSLGILAVANTFFSQLQRAGAYMSKVFRKDLNNPKTRKINHRLSNNKTANGNISLSSIMDALGLNRISDVFSQLINGAVDVAKKDWIFFINGIKEIIPNIAYLNMTGTPVLENIAFHTQPIINDFIETLKNYKSPLVKYTNRKAYNLAKIHAIYETIAKYADIPQTSTKLVPGQKIISKTDIDRFKEYVNKSNSKPKEFFTSDSKFTEFYQNDLGIRRGIPQTSKWFLNDKGYYDLIDQETGEFLIDNVDLATGVQYNEPTEINQPVSSTSALSHYIKDFKEIYEKVLEDPSMAPLFYGYMNNQMTALADKFMGYFKYEKFKDFAIPVEGKLKVPTTQEEKFAQVLYLVQFLEFESQQSTLSSVRTTMNQDTKKPINLQDSNERLLKQKEAQNHEILPKEIIKKLVTESTTKAFTSPTQGVDAFISKLLDKIFDVTDHPIFNQFLKDEFTKPHTYNPVKQDRKTKQFYLQTGYSNMPFNVRYDLKEAWIKAVKNDFIEYLAKNNLYLPNDPSTRVSDYFFTNLINYNIGLHVTLDTIKDKFPELLNNNLLLQYLEKDPSRIKVNGVPQYMNLKLKTERIEPVVEKVLIEAFKKLINFSDSNYSVDDQVLIRTFAQDLAYLAFNQSGLNSSKISFTKIIPQELYSEDLTNIIRSFKKLMDENPETAIKEFDTFYKLFKKNNSKFFRANDISKLYPQQQENAPAILDINFAKETNRGKNYVTPEAIDLLSKREQALKLIQEKQNQHIKDITAQQVFTSDIAKDNPRNLYVYNSNTDNNNKYQNMSIKVDNNTDYPNTIHIPTYKSFDGNYTDSDFSKIKVEIDAQIQNILSYIKQNNPTKVIFPQDILDRLNNAPKIKEYLQQQLNHYFDLSEKTPIFTGETTTNMPSKLEGKMTYSYGSNKREDITSTTTFDAILNGERTATTRYESDGKLDYWKSAKVGDIIKWESNDGRTVDVVVTKALHPLKGSGKNAEQWSKLEGWSKEYFDNKVRPKLDQAWQIEYKLATPTTELSTQSTTGVKVISADYGIVQAETNPTENKTQEFLDLVKPQIQAQTYKENVGKGANQMFHFGKMWSRVTAKANPLKINSFAPTEERDKLINAGENAKGNSMGISEYTYAYHELDQNGNPLPSLSQLQPIIDEIQRVLGRDMSDYDSVIGNIYQPNEFIFPHKDVTESKSAKGYPVIVYTMGANAGLGIVDNNKGKMTFANQYDSRFLRGNEKLKGYTNEVLTKNGTIYTFGMDGKGRFELTHSTPINDAKVGSQLPITLPNGKVITNYTITLTFRRAADLTPGMPKTPAIISTQPTISVKNFSKKNLFTVTPQQGVSDNKAKAKASIATQYIGFGEGIIGRDGKRSTTQIYREQVGALANTGNYSANDVIFVSIPGLRGDAEIAKREQNKTIKEAIKALEAGATIITDNKAYIDSSTYNTGEQRLYKNMEAKGYNYSEITVDGQVLGVWENTNKPSIEEEDISQEQPESTNIFDEEVVPNNQLDLFSTQFDALKDFTKERKEEIVNNFKNKHKMSTEQALRDINKGLELDKETMIQNLKDCY